MKLRFWSAVALILIGFNAIARSETNFVPARPPASIDIPSPDIEPIRPQKDTYSVGETIVYQVRIRWPQIQEDIRLNSPDVNVENLKFIGVSQESVTNESSHGLEQILNFQFTPLKPGIAKVNHISIGWTYGQGVQSTEVRIPGISLNATRSLSAFVKPLAWSVAGLLAFFGSLMTINRIRKKKILVEEPTLNRLEDSVLGELEKIKNDYDANVDSRIFLSRLNQVFEGYLRQKLDWNPKKAGYNELPKIIEEKWSKNEAIEVKRITQLLEETRFSEQNNNQALIHIYQIIYSFIKQRKVD